MRSRTVRGAASSPLPDGDNMFKLIVIIETGLASLKTVAEN
jgi:hypothetical protein